MVVEQSTGGGLRELALFAGAGGGILGGKLLGWRTVCAVEWDPYAAGVLIARQNDGLLPPFPIWDDVRTFDGRPWRGRVDVVSGGFPCQDISPAGARKGITGGRSGLWSEFARIIGEVLPRYAFIENSSDLAIRGLHRVLADLAAMGMDAEWGVFSACSTGAPHVRRRMFIVAYPARGRARQLRRFKCTEAGDAARNIHWSLSESDITRKVDGVAGVVDRLRAVGNGQVPEVAALAWSILTQS